uniref:hypothetical protein n=1 Tax=Odoribacter laneus TaxID=626933 RepID=UPI0040385CB4
TVFFQTERKSNFVQKICSMKGLNSLSIPLQGNERLDDISKPDLNLCFQDPDPKVLSPYHRQYFGYS